MERPQASLLTVGGWRVDGSADEIEADGRVVKLEPQQMRLLLVLAQRAGQVVLTQELLDEVWRDLVVTPNSVYQAVAQLRRQLGDTATEPAYIQTVHRKGYRLVAPVRWIEAHAVPAAPAAADVTAAITQPAPAPTPVPVPVQQPQPQVMAGRRLLLGGGALALTALSAAATWLALRPRAPTSTTRLAVLPLRTLGSAADQPLAQGLTADLIRRLGRRNDLEVLAPDATQGLDAVGAAQLGDLGRRLGVSHLLLGEMQLRGSLVHLDVRLYGTDSSAPLWQRQFQRSQAVVSQLPATMAGEVGAALGLAPLPGQAPPAGPSEAYELYVLGEHALRPKTPEAFDRARGYFQRGIELDPGFAPNYVGLAWTWLGQASVGTGIDLPQAMARATPLFDRALQIDPEAADALTGQAQLHQLAGEFEPARRLLARAIAAQPSYVQAHMSLGVVDFDEGWPARALPHFERAVRLSPLGAATVERLGLAQLFAGQTEAAAQSFRRAMTLEPRYPNGIWGLGIQGYAVGNLVQAVDGYRQALALEPRRPFLWHELAWLYLDLQRPDESAAAFARAAEHLPGSGWLPVNAALPWVLRSTAGDRDSPPPALALAPARADEGGAFVDLCLLRAMCGLPLDKALLQRSLDVATARGQWRAPISWFVFQGWHRPLNLATVQSLLGLAAESAATLDAVDRQLDALARQGNRWPMLDFHRGRVLALRGRPADALAALERAVAAGVRRAWWLRLDPALAPLREQPGFTRLLSGLDEQLARQRQQLGL